MNSSIFLSSPLPNGNEIGTDEDECREDASFVAAADMPRLESESALVNVPSDVITTVRITTKIATPMSKVLILTIMYMIESKLDDTAVGDVLLFFIALYEYPGNIKSPLQ